MGQEIGGREFSEEDFARFRSRLAQETRSLRETFAAGQCSNAGPFIGLELEVWLIDHNFFPAPHNQSFLERLADPSVVAELSQFNIEINAPVEQIEGRGLQRMHEHLSETMRRCATNAHEDVDTVVAIGTLPTLRQQDLQNSTCDELWGGGGAGVACSRLRTQKAPCPARAIFSPAFRMSCSRRRQLPSSFICKWRRHSFRAFTTRRSS